jgi:hypothetical protein
MRRQGRGAVSDPVPQASWDGYRAGGDRILPSRENEDVLGGVRCTEVGRVRVRERHEVEDERTEERAESGRGGARGVAVHGEVCEEGEEREEDVGSSGLECREEEGEVSRRVANGWM